MYLHEVVTGLKPLVLSLLDLKVPYNLNNLNGKLHTMCHVLSVLQAVLRSHELLKISSAAWLSVQLQSWYTAGLQSGWGHCPPPSLVTTQHRVLGQSRSDGAVMAQEASRLETLDHPSTGLYQFQSSSSSSQNSALLTTQRANAAVHPSKQY